ncbi:MAG: SDR family oxidoreductase [Flammeovirgaceae bacterium]|jgi:NAD(P)-dependent dehydrogenase (short-subunit alcohol dehydrogenase family)|nr:SDR family oxidoreductase [Flammeovirgaceae bacterium]
MKPVILITGISSGIGKATAGYLASNGMKVFGTIVEHVDGIQPHPDGYSILTMDVRDSDSVRFAVDSVLKVANRIDVVVNNAGISFSSSLEELDIKDARQILEVNTLGPLRVIQVALPSMRKNKRGLIINITSIGGQIAIPFDGMYSASKFALEGMSEALSLELIPFGVNVVILEPGDINTGMSAKSKSDRSINEKSPYYKYQTEAHNAAIENERAGSSPLIIAKKIEQIISDSHPSLRYLGGTLLERLMIPLKHLLPTRCFEYLVAKRYKLSAK